MSAVVKLVNITKAYRRGPEEIRALEDVSLTLDAGEVVALVGPSGSGKTTLLNVLAGWEHADSGSVEWTPDPGTPQEDLRWDSVAILPQSLGLVEEMSVRENVELPARVGNLPLGSVAASVDQLLDALGLSGFGDRPPSEISIGEQQRTSLARALVLGPKLLLADEPSGHQDARWAEGVFKTIRRAAKAGTSCLIATHNEELLRYVDRIVGIRDGHLVDVEHPGLMAADELISELEESAVEESPPAENEAPTAPAAAEEPPSSPAPDEPGDDLRSRFGPPGS